MQTPPTSIRTGSGVDAQPAGDFFDEQNATMI
jgi:hypothetical protein